MRSRLVLFGVFGLALGAGRNAHADPPAPTPTPHQYRPHWDPAWSHSNVWDYSLAGAGTAFIVFAEVVLQPVRPPLRWNGPILFDADVRNAWRTNDESTRNAAEGVSWALWGMQVGYPVLVDVPFAWARHSHQLAQDLFWQDAVTLTIAGAADLGIRDIAARSRPHTYQCLTDGGGSHCLDPVESDRSFPGGHMVNSTAATALTCTQHLYTKLYGGPWDAIVCATTIASDLTIGVLRVVSDNHWATDQLAGAAIGTLIGWGVPYVMHLHGHAVSAGDGAPAAPSKGPDAIVLAMPMTVDHGAGLGVTGLF